MKKWLIVIAALLPLSSMANMLTNTNEPYKPGYNPSQQRMQTQMQGQQQQQQQKLRQDQQQQNQEMQRKLQERRDSAQQRVITNQPGQSNATSNSGN
ncbi:DUF2756 domain-containing protein [Pantoea eucrina]|jgi:Spy/CpxP family protein refolding chaperone|uniref:DUF2756 domain-containing protein n=1 Tax=Pantoea eucrina TaxID=472693 RepID=A0ABU5LIK6_9GAMM|nr:DUF2756 domain-containing protein [Pantoea eucrina]MDZ7279781.1 DUF2756 domain-containing protein [Pantoea eucrina]